MNMNLLVPSPPDRLSKGAHRVEAKPNLQVFIYTPSGMKRIEWPVAECYVTYAQFQEVWGDYLRLTQNFIVAQEENNRLHQT